MTINYETVHLAIDIQNSFFKAPYWNDENFDIFKTNMLKLINGLKTINIPTLQIIHIDNDATFTKASGLAVPMDFMPTNLKGTFEKHVHNALSESGLHEWLQQHNVRNVIISGIRTEQCCETTTRIASDYGYNVDYVTEATLTFPMVHKPSGKIFSVDDIKQKTELVLADRFAEIHTVDTVLGKHK